MCSQFLTRMENYEGDLADIVRATASTADGGGGAGAPDWQFASNPFAASIEDFGDPFTYMMKDPLMHNNSIDSSSSGFFFSSNINEEKGCLNLADHDENIKRPPNIFSRMLQISPNAKLPVSAPPAAAVAAPPPSKGGSRLVPHVNPGLQISSPRNTGIKRRKSQAKKVVCIPAPAPANSRSTGEVVPSDLWAWRKYGQKPIKGSPYPRGYYRCSSSKGCSARKQVERSRTDPNMLVITYTSEHNHPWPTQRNALAGSTRSQPSKNTTPSSKNSSPNSQTHKPEEHMKETSAAVKEEIIADQDFDNQLEMEEADPFEEGFAQTYKPAMADSIHSEDSFFADLGEIEVDPLNLLFTQGFSRDDSGRENNDLDPFSFYDWATSNDNTTAAAVVSSGECKRDS